MMRSMFAAISGLKVHQVMLDVTANDISNVNTIAFKGGRTTFQDALTQVQRTGVGPSPTLAGSNPTEIGLGVQLGSIDNLMGTGSLQSTGNALDVAIQGDGWFRVGAGSPPAVPTNAECTRAGNFTRNEAGYLVTQDGMYVIGRSAAGTGGADTLLQVPTDSGEVAIGQDGSVSYVPAGGGARVVAGYLSLAKFANQAGMSRNGAHRWVATGASGPEQVATPGGAYGITTAGTVEMSNVDLAAEFTNMIMAQRGFQANSRVISTADEMLQDLVNLKR